MNCCLDAGSHFLHCSHRRAIAYRIDRMNRAVRAALDDAPQMLVEAMPITEHDRHVLALAVHVEADIIITFNLRNVSADACEPCGVEAVDPDMFVVAVVERDLARVQAGLAAIPRRRSRLAMTVREILGWLAAVLPTFVSRMRATATGTA